MKITTLRYFDFAASRLLPDGRMSGNNFNGWAGVVGPVDQQTGMLINIVDLKKLLADTLDGYDHRFLNAQLEDVEPSTLNISKAIYSDLATSLPAGISMESLSLAELDQNAVLITPEADVQIVRGGFSAAHRTHAPQLSQAENQARYGICNNPTGHGHNYQVEIALPPGEDIPDDLWEQFDHRNLSVDLPELEGRNAVTEAIAALIALRVPVAQSVRVWETPDFFAEYLPGEDRYHLGRRYRFHAAHRLNNPRMSAEQNRRIYGKCNRPDPHGHTYITQVTVSPQRGHGFSQGRSMNVHLLLLSSSKSRQKWTDGFYQW